MSIAVKEVNVSEFTTVEVLSTELIEPQGTNTGPIKVVKGEKGEPFEYSDFTPEQLEALRGPKGEDFKYSDFTQEQLAALKGNKGDTPEISIGTVTTLDEGSDATASIDGTAEKPVLNLGIPKGNTGKAFEYSDFTEEQLEALRGPKGNAFTYEDFTAEQLAALKGDAFTYKDFTPEQLAALKGEKGEDFKYSDFTPEQLAALKGEKGDAFEYSDFTPEQLEALRGPKGDSYTHPTHTARARGFYKITVDELGHVSDVSAVEKKDVTDLGIAESEHSHTKSQITDFPETIPPSAHSHKKSDITDFDHTHTKSDITDFPETMPPSAHNHSKSEIIDFPKTMPPSSHSHSKSDITDFPSSMPASDVSDWAKATTKPTYTASEVGAEKSGAVSTHNSASTAHSALFAAKEDKPANVSLSGAVTLTVQDNTIYSMTGVTSLALTGAAVECHGFVTFGSSKPTVTVSGFSASGGDDITGAAASQVWEFSVFPHNGGSYIVFKNWSA